MEKSFKIILTCLLVLNLLGMVIMIKTSLNRTEKIECVSDDINDVNNDVNRVKNNLDDLSISIDDILFNQNKNNTTNNTLNSGFTFLEIWVDDEYYIHRTADANLRNIGWNILYNGEDVLERNAEGETEYRYFGNDSGVYTIYLTAFIDGAYRVVSNVVSYTL